MSRSNPRMSSSEMIQNHFADYHIQMVLRQELMGPEKNIAFKRLLDFITDEATQKSEPTSEPNDADVYSISKLSSLTHYQMAVGYMQALSAYIVKRRIKPVHVEAAVNLLSQFQYNTDITSAFDEQSKVFSLVAAACTMSDKKWRQTRRHERIQRLNDMMFVTDYLMEQRRPGAKSDKAKKTVIYDEKYMDSSKRYKGAIKGDAYHNSVRNVIGYVYNRHTNTLADQKWTYECQTHEMVHRTDFLTKCSNPSKRAKERFTNPEHLEIRTISNSINHLFRKNKKRMTGLASERNESIRKIYHADIVERVAYKGNNIFRDVYYGATVDQLQDLKKELGDCPPEHAWLHDEIDGKIERYNEVQNLKLATNNSITQCENTHEMFTRLGIIQDIKKNDWSIENYILDLLNIYGDNPVAPFSDAPKPSMGPSGLSQTP